MNKALPHLFPERCDAIAFLKALPYTRLGSAALSKGRVAFDTATEQVLHVHPLASRRHALQQQMIQAVLADDSATIDRLFLYDRADPTLSTTTGMPLLEFAKERGKSNASRCLQKWGRLYMMLKGLRTKFAVTSRANGEPLMRSLDTSGRGYLLPSEFVRMLQTSFDVQKESDAWVLYHLVTISKEDCDAVARGISGCAAVRDTSAVVASQASDAENGTLSVVINNGNGSNSSSERRSSVFDALNSWRATTFAGQTGSQLCDGRVSDDGVRITPYRLRAFINSAHTDPGAAKLLVAHCAGHLVAVVSSEDGIRVAQMPVINGVLDATELVEGRYRVQLLTDLCSAVRPACPSSLLPLATFLIVKDGGKVILENHVLELTDVHHLEIMPSSYEYFPENVILQGRFEAALCATPGAGGGGGGGGVGNGEACVVALKPEPGMGSVSLLLPPGRLTLFPPSGQVEGTGPSETSRTPKQASLEKVQLRQGGRRRNRSSLQRMYDGDDGSPSDFIVTIPVAPVDAPMQHNSYRVSDSSWSPKACFVKSWGQSVRTKFREAVWRAINRRQDRPLEPSHSKARCASWITEAKVVSSAPSFQDILYKPDSDHETMHSDNQSKEEEFRRLIFPLPGDTRQASVGDMVSDNYAVPVYNGASPRSNDCKTVDVVQLCLQPSETEVQNLLGAPAVSASPEVFASPFAVFADSSAAITTPVTDEAKKGIVLAACRRAAEDGGSDGSMVVLEVQVGHVVQGNREMDAQPLVPSLRAVAAALVSPAPGGSQDVVLRFTLRPDVRLKQNCFNFGPKNVQFLANGSVVAEARLDVVPESSMCMPTSFAFFNAVTRCGPCPLALNEPPLSVRSSCTALSRMFIHCLIPLQGADPQCQRRAGIGRRDGKARVRRLERSWNGGRKSNCRRRGRRHNRMQWFQPAQACVLAVLERSVHTKVRVHVP